MKIIFHDGPELYETQGLGQILRGVPRELPDDYAKDLIARGEVEPYVETVPVSEPAVAPAEE